MDEQMWREEFGKRLEHFLYERGINRSELASEVNVMPSTIHRYLNGERIPSSYVLIRLARALDVNPSDLIDF